MNELSLDDKLYRTRFETDHDFCHITVDDAICRECDTKVCLCICPAGVYVANPNDENLIVVQHENCLECGTCRIICGNKGIHWQFPRGGMGVKYRYG